jgi:hypothetical protein
MIDIQALNKVTKALCTIIFLMCMVITSIAAQDPFADIFGQVEESGTIKEAPFPIRISGDLGASLQYRPEFTVLSRSQVSALPFLNLNLNWQTAKIDAMANLSLEPRSLTDPLYWEDLVDELILRRYFDWGRMEAALMRREWGKGEGIHAVDPLNALDQRYGIVANLNDMKIPEMMLSFQLQKQSSILELIYKPFFEPMRLAMDGMWSVVDEEFSALITDSTTITDTHTLAFSQLAARARTQLASVDLGLIYYHGYYSQPSYEITMGPHPLDPSQYIPTGIESIHYTKAQLFGVESATTVGPLTLLFEGGFWLSEDTAGTEATLYNSKIVYQGGLEFMLPNTAIFTSLQWNGHYVLNFDGLQFPDVDVLQAYDGKAHANMIVAAMEIPLLREHVQVRLAGMCQLESRGYLLLPAVTLNLDDSLKLEISANIFGAIGSDAPQSIYKRWSANDTLEVGLTYQF